jgi:Sulfotransferase domain
MALRVIGAGLGRTGTLSLKLALEQIGFGPCYHMMEVRPHPERVAQWRRIAAGEPVDWEAVFAGFAATVDWPACNYYRELMARYPDAKVILSLREASGWFRSTQATIFGDAVQRQAPPFVAKILAAVVGDDLHDRERCIAAFERHNAEVKAFVPKDRLLVFDAAEGWKPLCAFLGVPVPDTPFPSVNTTEQFQAMIDARKGAEER